MHARTRTSGKIPSQRRMAPSRRVASNPLSPPYADHTLCTRLIIAIFSNLSQHYLTPPILISPTISLFFSRGFLLFVDSHHDCGTFYHCIWMHSRLFGTIIRVLSFSPDFLSPLISIRFHDLLPFVVFVALDTSFFYPSANAKVDRHIYPDAPLEGKRTAENSMIVPSGMSTEFTCL